VHVQVVAHEDDDLLFMNPDVMAAISCGAGVVTIYLTAGDAGRGAAYWSGRETGVHAAYAQMAAVENRWTTSELVAAGKSIDVETLVGMPSIRVAFLRLPDGNMYGQGFATTGAVSLQQLWRGTIDQLGSVDGANSFSAKELVTALAELVVGFGATSVSTLDSSGYYGMSFTSSTDHSDHFYSALFANAAVAQLSASVASRMYRGYNISLDPTNLDPETADDKALAFLAYAANDRALCPNPKSCALHGELDDWVHREYQVVDDPFPAASIVGIGYKCLTAAAGSSANAIPLQLFACTGAREQQWQLAADGSLRGGAGTCAEVAGANRANGTNLQLRACADVPEQKFSSTDDGHLRGLGGKCLDARGAKRADGTQVQLWDCLNVPQQAWTFH